MSEHAAIIGLEGNPRAIESAAPLLRDMEINDLIEHVPNIIRTIIGDTMSFSSGAMKTSPSSSPLLTEEARKKQSSSSSSSSNILMTLKIEQPLLYAMWTNDIHGNETDAAWINVKSALVTAYQQALPRASEKRKLTEHDLEYIYQAKLSNKKKKRQRRTYDSISACAC